MAVKLVLSLVLLACLLLVDSCDRCSGRGSCKRCSGNSRCRKRRSSDILDKKQIEGSEKEEAPYNIKLKGNPCNFNSYDIDGNGEITKEELQAIFCINEETHDLFLDLDIMTEDGVIRPDEFYSKAPLIIAECSDSDKKTSRKAE